MKINVGEQPRAEKGNINGVTANIIDQMNQQTKRHRPDKKSHYTQR